MTELTALLSRFLRSEPLPPPTRFRTTRSEVIAASVVLVAALVIHFAYLGLVGLEWRRAFDFYVFYTSTRVARLGLSPYKDPGPVIDLNHKDLREGAAYALPVFMRDGKLDPNPKDLSEAAGGVLPRAGTVDGPIPPGHRWGMWVSYPPQGYLLFLPFSLPSWHKALWAWLTFLTLMAVACGTLVWPAPGGGLRSPLAPAVVIALVLLNPISELLFSTGQCSIVICGAVALGQWALRRGHRFMAAVAWTVCSIKPQLGLPLIALSLPLGGWRFLRNICIGVVLLTIVGEMVVTGNPTMVLDWLESLKRFPSLYPCVPQSNQTVGWNRLLYVLGGPAIQLSVGWIVAGHLVACLLLFTKFLTGGGRSWAPSYWLAMCTAIPFTFALTHDYDMVVLVLLTPYLLELWDHRARLVPGLVGATLAFAMIPKSVMAETSRRLLGIDDSTTGLLNGHKALAGLVIFALMLLSPAVFGRRHASGADVQEGGYPATAGA